MRQFSQVPEFRHETGRGRNPFPATSLPKCSGVPKNIGNPFPAAMNPASFASKAAAPGSPQHESNPLSQRPLMNKELYPETITENSSNLSLHPAKWVHLNHRSNCSPFLK